MLCNKEVPVFIVVQWTSGREIHAWYDREEADEEQEAKGVGGAQGSQGADVMR